MRGAITVDVRPCPICSACRARNYCQVEAIHFVRCDACGSLYQAEPPDRERLQDLYASPRYRTSRGHGADAAIDAAKRATTITYLQLLARSRPPGRRYLEVGCSTGIALRVAAEHGWDVRGVEVSADAAAAARRQPSVAAVHSGSLLDAPFDRASFDVITMFDVIEHVEAPAATLRRAQELLSADGILLLVTPDAGSVSARVLGPRWPHLFPEHVICFTRPALRRLLEDCGLRVERIAFAWKRVNLNMLLRHARLHRHVVGGSIVRGIGAVAPRFLLSCNVPFNVGEFYVLARRPPA